MGRKSYLLGLLGLLLISSFCLAEEEKTEEPTETEPPTVDEDVGKSRDGSKTDDEAVQREEEAIKLDGLNVAQMKELREKAEKHTFQAEVSRMMKLIINSLYRNKEIFLRELISNSSDALDKIRFLSLTDKSALAATEELSIKIKADKENNILHVTDTGIGMTKDDLVKNLGTIAKSGTSEFFQKMADTQSSDQASDLIGQFGVGFYSTFLVADRVIVTSKHNDDKQYIWESDAASFSITEDPRGDTLKRGTTVSLHLKEEARDFLEPDTIKDLVKKYSQFINFNIYLWTSKTEEVEEPVEEEAAEDKKADEAAEDKKDEEKEEEKKDEDKEKEDKDDDAEVEEESEEKEKKPKTKKVEKTTWDWELINTNKPIWSRKPKDVKDEEYNEFYKSFTKDHDEPLAKTHFVAEGEVTFRSILYVPKSAPNNLFSEYGKKMDQIKLYVRRVFITDNFEDMMPKYLSFIRGVVDSDDLPLNVSRENLQQHKLLKVIKKKLVRKALDMIKKIPKEEYMDKFWKEFSTSIKLGVMEDHSNRTRLAKLLRFFSSNSEKDMTSLADYLERMKEKQDAIYFMAGTSRKEVESSPFVERLLKKGYEVLYLIEPVDEYCIQSLPEFEGKKFQNVAKEGLKIGEESEKQKKKLEALESTYEPLLKWLKEDALKDLIEKAAISQRLDESPCALVASSYGWSGNMERIMRSQAYAKREDPSNEYYANQKRTLEVNPRHPLVKELLKRVETDKEDKTAKDLARVLFETATLRSGYMVKDSQDFAGRIERMLRLSMGVDLEAMVEPEEEEAEEKEEEDKDTEERIAKLRSLDVMDTKNTDTEYDLITRISAAIIGTPIVLVSLVAEDKQWFKSRCGLEANETSRASSFCAYTLVSTDLADAHVLIVTDARRDLRFMRNPLVLGEPYIQFYCGVPLITSEGLRMGSLCCIDSKPRDISPKELGLQINFGYLTSQALESKYLEEQNSQEPREGISKEEEHFLGGRLRAEAMCDFGRTAICLVWARPDSMDWPLMYGSKVWTELTGVEVIPPSKFPGQAVIRSEVGKTWPAILGSGESFWDYARMASRDSQSILELWKVVLQAMQGERQDSKPGFAILVSLKSPRSSSVSKLLSCRFTPAEMPLGEGAAVVKNHGLAHSTEKWPRPKGFAADGHWFFIQMVPEKEENLPEIQSPRPCPPDSPGQSETPSLKVFRDDEPLTTKPPTPPFQDVRLVRLVGQGSFGCVYFSLWSGAAVACKVIKTVITKKNQKDLEELTAKPHFEAILSLRISHPNLVQTFKHGERALELKKAQKVYETWIVQEWCDGGTLQSICNEARMEGKRLLESLEIFLEISRAGQYLHEIGLIHGDLTSNNILLKSMPISKGFICKVCDFGLCRILGDDSEEIKTNSLGTLSYMPPEVLQSQDHSLTRKTDVYSLGMIVWIVLTGKAPYPGLTAPQVVIQVSRGKRPVLPENLPEDLLAAFRSTLAESPESRPNFSELVDQFSKTYKDLGGMDDDEAFLIETQAEKYRASQSAPNTLDNKT